MHFPMPPATVGRIQQDLQANILKEEGIIPPCLTYIIRILIDGKELETTKDLNGDNGIIKTNLKILTWQENQFVL